MSKKNTETEVAPQALQARVMRSKQKVHIDHFKLLLATKMVNIAPQGSRPGEGGFEPRWIEQEHVHFFHSFDSNGKQQFKSTSIAGHFHEITVTPQGKDQPPKISVGPAVKEARMKDKRKGWITILVAADEDKEHVSECHTHTPQYMYSEEVETRDINKEAMQLEGLEAQKGAAVQGVIG